jgi:Domain of unknown function (DUF5615)
VLDIRGSAEEGSDDPLLWEIALSQQRLLITTDKGFSRQRFEAHYGILIVRLRQPNRHKIHQRILDAMSMVPVEDWPGLLVTLRDQVSSLWRTRSLV